MEAKVVAITPTTATSTCVVRPPHRSSSNICKYWANGNCCMHKNHCYNLHSWSDGILVSHNKRDNPKPMRLVWWTAPPENFVKVNCDAAFSTFHGAKASAGGIVRDSKGHFLVGFSTILHNCDSVVEAELLAIKIGIELTITLGFTRLVVESDSYTAVQFINSGVQTSHSCHALVSSILMIASMADIICCNHVFREVNSVADGFAKHGLSLSPRSTVQFFRSPPSFTLSSLCADKAGVTYSR